MTLLDRYEVHEQLGAGSMGLVHRARDLQLNREVAVKMMRMGANIDRELRERFNREASACLGLRHPGIVAVYDLGESGETAFIVMELLEGADWRRAIKEGHPIPLRTRLELSVQVAEALSHAHRNNIVHRDIKPSNLYIHRGAEAKILDFGVARLPASQLTITGRVLGTPNYMAPEQIYGHKCDARSDLFSAAIVFFEFLTGVHPFRAAFIPRRIVDGDPERIRDHDAALPAALDGIFERALAREAGDRFQDGGELAAALRHVAESAGTAYPAEAASLAPSGDEDALDQTATMPPPRRVDETR